MDPLIKRNPAGALLVFIPGTCFMLGRFCQKKRPGIKPLSGSPKRISYGNSQYFCGLHTLEPFADPARRGGVAFRYLLAMLPVCSSCYCSLRRKFERSSRRTADHSDSRLSATLSSDALAKATHAHRILLLPPLRKTTLTMQTMRMPRPAAAMHMPRPAAAATATTTKEYYFSCLYFLLLGCILFVFWLLGFPASWLCFSGFWLLGFAASRLICLIASWLLGFLASWLLLQVHCLFLTILFPTVQQDHVTIMFVVGQDCPDHVVCKRGWGAPPNPRLSKNHLCYGKKKTCHQHGAVVPQRTVAL